MRKMLMLCVVLMSVSSLAFGQGLTSDIKVGDGTLKLHGCVQATASWEKVWRDRMIDGQTYSWEEWESDCRLGSTRLHALWLPGPESDWAAGTVIEFSDLQFDDGGNWLREAYVQYRLNDNWRIRTGRLFLSVGRTTPPPVMLETVSYPAATPYQAYALMASRPCGKIQPMIPIGN